MKKVLFIGVTGRSLAKNGDFHLAGKYKGLTSGMEVFDLAKGGPAHIKKWGADFYLLPSGILFWPICFMAAFWICLTKKIDVIVSQSPLIDGFLGVILKKILKKELIIEIHGDWKEGPFLSKKRRMEFLQRKFIPFLAKISLKNADKIRTVAKYLAEEARKIAPDKPYILFPTFTDLDIFLNEKEVRSNNYILFVGTLEKVKGVEYLIEAFSKIHKNFSEFRLLIIGKGSEENYLKDMALKFNIADKVEFRGKLSLIETKDIMKDCYCFILPSLSEGLPRVIIEAMALSKPVIGSDAGGIPELVQDGINGFLFKSGDSGSLAEKMRTLLSKKELAKEFGIKGRMFAEQNFSNDKYIENYIKMINN
ncbi:MAG: glycosyltransferase family 4 protein [Candidatus Parcubacteria bacterium]|nr:glycosyltransferase family 4 protein [Candidatus Parcubacteria bacterium]